MDEKTASATPYIDGLGLKYHGHIIVGQARKGSSLPMPKPYQKVMVDESDIIKIAEAMYKEMNEDGLNLEEVNRKQKITCVEEAAILALLREEKVREAYAVLKHTNRRWLER